MFDKRFLLHVVGFASIEKGFDTCMINILSTLHVESYINHVICIISELVEIRTADLRRLTPTSDTIQLIGRSREGTPEMRPRPISFIFMIFLGKFWPVNKLMPPPSGISWIRQ